MAVPTAVKRQRERLEAELGLNTKPEGEGLLEGDPSLSLAPPVETPPVIESTPPELPDVAAKDARIAELEQLLRTRDGQTSASTREANDAKARAELLASQVASLEEAVTELQKQKETAESLAAARRADSDIPSLDDVADPTPEEIEKFGDDSVRFVNQLSKKQLVGYVRPLMAKVAALEKSLARLSDLDRLPQLENVVKNAQAESQRVKDEEFFRTEVLAHFPDFTKVRETQEWKDYLAADIPGKGIKNGHLLNHYRLMHDAANIRAFIQGYVDQTKSRTTLASLATPGKTQTEGSPVQKPKLKASEYKAKLKAFTQRQLPKADWEDFKTVFNTALAEGRVEHDARL